MGNLEGNGAQRLLSMFSPTADKVEVKLGVVNATSPDVSIRIEGESIDTPRAGLIFSDTVTSKLIVGTQVICLIANSGQLVFVIDRVVK